MKLQSVSCREKLAQPVEKKKPQRRNRNLFTSFYEIDYVDHKQHIHIFQSQWDHFLSRYLLHLLTLYNLLMYAFWHHPFQQVLFVMSKNEDVVSQPVKVKRNINASCCSSVILGQILLILQNLSFPKLKWTSLFYYESRRDKWTSNSAITSLSIVLTTVFLKPSRRQCFTWTIIFVSASSCVLSM